MVQPLQPALAGQADAFAAKLRPDGASLEYSTYLGGALNDYAYGIAVDAKRLQIDRQFLTQDQATHHPGGAGRHRIRVDEHAAEPRGDMPGHRPGHVQRRVRRADGQDRASLLGQRRDRPGVDQPGRLGPGAGGRAAPG